MTDDAAPEDYDELSTDELRKAREQEQLHRQLQQQDGDRDDERTPAARERDDAIEQAISDVEQSVEEAHERLDRSKPSPPVQ